MRNQVLYRQWRIIHIIYNGGVPRHLAMSIGFELAHNSDAISKMIKDEQL